MAVPTRKRRRSLRNSVRGSLRRLRNSMRSSRTNSSQKDKAAKHTKHDFTSEEAKGLNTTTTHSRLSKTRGTSSTQVRKRRCPSPLFYGGVLASTGVIGLMLTSTTFLGGGSSNSNSTSSNSTCSMTNMTIGGMNSTSGNSTSCEEDLHLIRSGLLIAWGSLAAVGGVVCAVACAVKKYVSSNLPGDKEADVKEDMVLEEVVVASTSDGNNVDNKNQRETD